MERKDMKSLSRKELDKTLIQVDKVVMRKYISDIDKRPVYKPSYKISFDKAQNIENPVCV